MKAAFLRLLEAEEKDQALLAMVRSTDWAQHRLRFEVAPTSFAAVPGTPFAYWVSGSLRRRFGELPPFEAEGRTAKQGLVTADDFRFVRARWEIPVGGTEVRWLGFPKGGAFSRYYSDVHLLVGYSRGDQVGLQAIGRYGRGATHYLRPGLTWPRRTNGLSFRVMPAGCIFSDKGPAAFVARDDRPALLALSAVMNSGPFGALVSLQLARTELAQSYEVGLVQQTPVPSVSSTDEASLAALAGLAWSLTRSLDTSTATSSAFSLPALLQVPGGNLACRAVAWSVSVQAAETELAAIQKEIDAVCFALYDIDEADRRSISEGFGTSPAEADPAPDDEDAEETQADASSLTAELVSWAAGVAFGRFDVRLATGERSAPPEPDPFDPLPVCSPGMLTGDDGLPLSAPPPGYPVAFPADGVLVDEPGHARDLTAAVRAVFDVVFGADAEARWREAAELLDPKGHDLRAWLSGCFFEHHLKRYSKSRRKAPILWQLATPSGSYSLWLYAHRLTSDTFFHLQNEFVGPKLTHEERKLTSLVQDGGPNPTPSARKAIEKQEAFVGELRAFREEIARVAPLWKPDLNDGVLLTAAPLWRLVPQHRAWQRELRSAWEALASGKYDWANVAMHLWPERVVPKCAIDRSLAIAHELENVFWVEGPAGKWKARPKPTRAVEDVVAERDSAAVKAALGSLLGATPTGPKGSGRPARSRGSR